MKWHVPFDFTVRFAVSAPGTLVVVLTLGP
jgi:hypothetical protein